MSAGTFKMVSKFISSITTIAVRSFVMLAMGMGSEPFSLRTTLFEEQSTQNIALALTLGDAPARKVFGAFNGAILAGDP